MTEQRYLRIISKWWWLVVAAALFAGLVAYQYTQRQPNLYQARARLIIGPAIDNPSPDYNALRASGQMIQTYAELPKTGSFLQSVINDLGLNLTIDQLSDMISVETNTETQIMTIRVQHPSGQRAIDIANAVVDRLVGLSPSGTESEQSLLSGRIRIQIANLERTIGETEARIEQLETDLEDYQERIQASTITSFREIAAGEETLDKFLLQFQEAVDVQGRRIVSEHILAHLISTSNGRISALEDWLRGTNNLGMRQLILSQVALERAHLSDIQSANAEIKRSIDGQPLELYIDNLRSRIATYESELQNTLGLDAKRLIDDQIVQERGRLAEALQIETDRQQLILEKITAERGRVSALQGLDVEILSQTQAQIELERGRLSDQQRTLSTLYQPLQQSAANQAQVIEQAESFTRVPDQSQLYILLAGIAGLMLSLVIVFVYEYWEDKVETSEELAAATSGPVLGKVAAEPLSFKREPPAIVTRRQPESLAAKDYRMLGAKLLFSLNSPALRTILIGSPDADQEAAKAAANLAAVLAMAGKRVILLDANLDHPEAGELFELQENQEADDSPAEGSNKRALLPVESLPGLSLYRNGSNPGETFQLLASSYFSETVDQFKDQADLVLVVSPPLKRAESLILASKLDGVILVVPANRIRRSALNELSSALQASGANYLGAVFKYFPPLYTRLFELFQIRSRKPEAPAGEDLQAQDPYSLPQGSPSDVPSSLEL
jgi:capsular polysaccharide biosynthesis protein/Mrp family chromosome partitioning ATPase